MIDTDRVVVSAVVPIGPDAAFALFTGDVDAWWRRGPRYRVFAHTRSTMLFEPRVGGRFMETCADDPSRTFVVGTVRVWEPPRRLCFDWRAPEFEPHEKTEVDIRFEPFERATRVTIEHRGWDSIRKDHPARRGLFGPAFKHVIGNWWADLCVALQSQAGDSGPKD